MKKNIFRTGLMLNRINEGERRDEEGTGIMVRITIKQVKRNSCCR